MSDFSATILEFLVRVFSVVLKPFIIVGLFLFHFLKDVLKDAYGRFVKYLGYILFVIGLYYFGKFIVGLLN